MVLLVHYSSFVLVHHYYAFVLVLVGFVLVRTVFLALSETAGQVFSRERKRKKAMMRNYTKEKKWLLLMMRILNHKKNFEQKHHQKAEAEFRSCEKDGDGDSDKRQKPQERREWERRAGAMRYPD